MSYFYLMGFLNSFNEYFTNVFNLTKNSELIMVKLLLSIRM